MASPPRKKTWAQQYLSEWECHPALKGWLTSSKRTPSKAFCTLCQKDLEFQAGGIRDLQRHATRESHVRAARARETTSDLGKAFQAKQSDSVSVAATNGVLRFGFFKAEHHIPLSTADHLVKVVAAVCPDSKIAAEMKGARTKMTAAIRTIAADMHAELAQVMKTGFFTIIPDESMDVAVTEQIGIAVRVFEKGVVRTLSYGLRSVSSQSAAAIFEGINGLAEDDGIPWTNFVGHTSDGANVMRGKHNAVLIRLEEKQPNVYPLHCACHVANLCCR